MKILKNLAKTIEDMMEKYNEYASEGKQMDWAAYIDAAIGSALEGDHTDWSKAAHLEFLDKSFQIVRVFPSKEIYHQVMSKVGHNTEISFDDAMCFVCRNYLVKFELMAKKARLDATWDGDNVLIALYTCGKLTDGVKDFNNRLTMTCPDCGHDDFAIFYESRRLFCHGGKCSKFRQGDHDIWDLLVDESDSFASVVNAVYTALVDNHAASMDIVDNMDYTVRRKKEADSSDGDCDGEYDNANIDKIINILKPNYDYMYQFGFSRKDLEDCDCVGYRDDTEVNRCNESNEFRRRLCWAIKDVDGKIVGLQGRSVLDTEERADFAENDGLFQKMYWNNPKYLKTFTELTKEGKEKMKKIKEKVLNTSGFTKSNHLYLLYKYVQNPSQYRAVVITEGVKDAMRVYQQRIPDIAVVSSFGCKLSRRQIWLLKAVFGTGIQIKLAYDGDAAGYHGSIKAAKDLTEAGFTDIKFVLYDKRNSTEYYKDFGDVYTRYLPKTVEMIYRMLKGVRHDKYVEEMSARGLVQTQVVEAKKVVVEQTTDNISEKVKQSIIEMLRAKKQAAAGKIAV